MKRIILVALVFALGCQNNQNTQKELELAQREKAVLEKENALLKQKQPKKEPAPTKQSITPENLIGMWDVEYLCTITDCRNVHKEGSSYFEHWRIDYIEGKIVAYITNPVFRKFQKYSGEIVGQKLRLRCDYTGLLFVGKINLEFDIKNENTLNGTANLNIGSGPEGCYGIYGVTVTKPGPTVKF